MRVHVLLTRLSLGLLLLVCVPGPTARCEPSREAAPASAPALGAALATFEEAELRADVQWIAADERRGRDTPSEGLEATARYLAARLGELGFDHGARDGYLYRYPLTWRQLDASGSELVFRRGDDSLALSFGADYMLGRIGDVCDVDASGACVSIGRGDRSDFKGVNLEGKWAWCLDDGSSSRRTLSRAEEAGAVGVVFTPGEGYDRDAYAERFAGVIQYVLRGSLGRSAPDRERPDEIPGVFVTRSAARRVLQLAGKSSAADLRAGTELPLTVSERRRMTYPGGYRLFENVCGLWPGEDPALRNEVIIVSAHYDHVGTRGEDIYNGADDNASGSAALLAVARALRTYGPMRRSVLLMWVSGEEKGLLGSHAWTVRPWLPEGMYPVANVNVDMIGRNDPEKLLITPSRRLKGEYNGLVRLAERLAPTEGFPSLGSADEFWRRSDHMNFADNLNLPVAFLFADVHPDYHKPTDTADKIDYDKLRRGARLILRILDGLQRDELDLRDRDVPPAAEFATKVRRATALSELELLASALDRFRLVHDAWPADLDALLAEVELPGLSGEVPEDPWGAPYVLDRSDAVAPRLVCWGADGRPGGKGADEDLAVPVW